MNAKNWGPSVFGGAVFGGLLWTVLLTRTGIFDPVPGARGVPTVGAAALLIAIGGIALYRYRAPRAGVAITLGALLGLPILVSLTMFGSAT
ncbi:MAG: hypothetical protein WAV90_25670 [Gordonia amarae]